MIHKAGINKDIPEKRNPNKRDLANKRIRLQTAETKGTANRLVPIKPNHESDEIGKQNKYENNQTNWNMISPYIHIFFSRLYFSQNNLIWFKNFGIRKVVFWKLFEMRINSWNMEMSKFW